MSRTLSAKIGALLAVLLVLALGAPATAQIPPPPNLEDGIEPPLPDPAFLGPVPGADCTITNEYEAAYFGMEVGNVRYPGQCKRIRHAFGPIVVKPGENDALVEPVTIEKPAFDGLMLRFKPDLLLAATGQPPPTDHMHLHHATWLGVSRHGNYGSGPLFAAGEEKTHLILPEGYGQPVSGDDVWLLLYMVHNEYPDSQVVWLTYEIDMLPTDAVEEHGLLPARQIWLDVQNSANHPESPSTGSNPVFNVQRGFGQPDVDTGRLVCTWPRENCARHDTYGMVTPNQGQTVDRNGNDIVIHGNDVTVSSGLAGTLVVMGGHLHPGGIRDEVSLVREIDGEWVEKPIFLSDALYWDWEETDKVGGPPWSWNFSMTGTAPDWRVNIKPGDRIRINAVYDSEDASWYEGMGIVMAWVAAETHGEPTVDVFDDDVVLDRGVATSVHVPDGPYDPAYDWRPDDCEMDLSGQQKRLCLRGGVTHGHLHESGNFSGGCREEGACPDLPEPAGSVIDELVTDEIVSAGFTYGQAELGLVGALGYPQLLVGETARFWNFDTVARVWHTFTRCEKPCNGPTDMAYPIANGGGIPEDPMANHMDFDSNEIGWGTPFEPAAGRLPAYEQKGWEQTIRDGLYWEFEPTETGVYTFYCRIHHWMRGAFEVVEDR